MQGLDFKSARDLDALVTYATTLPFARPDGVVVVGQSAGGWATVAYDSRPHPKVVAMVNMAGGRGGHQQGLANHNCGRTNWRVPRDCYGATASTPMLWVFTANDSFFAPQIATEVYEAFVNSGGKADIVQIGPFGTDGHNLFFGRGGSAIWGPLVEKYLAARARGG